MVSMSSWMSSLKAVLVSAGVVSVALGIKLSAPFVVDGVPAVWSAILLWMKPLYLYIIINGIIITIAAASRFQQSQSPETPAFRSEQLYSVKTPPPMNFASFSPQPDLSSAAEYSAAATAMAEVVEPEIKYMVDESKPIVASHPKSDAESEKEIVVYAEAEDSSINTLPKENVSTELQFEFLLPVREKPLVSSRFGHRKQIRSNPEGARVLRVARPKRQETLESTWKMITEGRHVPLTRHQKKPDAAWDHDAPPKPEDRAGNDPLVRIRKEASVGQDELNRRVEAFIKKFNEDLRIQRQDSLQQFKDMINRGV